MSGSLNVVHLIGHLGRDPETRFMPNGDAVANFSIATSRSWKDQQGNRQESTEWHRITTFRKLAEIVGEYLKKGSYVYVSGRLQTREWTDKEGVKRYTTEIVANEMQMLGKKGDTQPDAEPKTKPRPAEEVPAGDFDDDIPFERGD